MSEALPSAVKDPFDADAELQLASADLPNFNLVDGTVAVATDPDSAFILFKGNNRDTWFYAPRWGRIAKNKEQDPEFLVTKKVRNNPDGSKTTIGGVLSFMVELVVELPDDAERERWAELIQNLYNLQPSAGQFNFQPLRLAPGKMDIFGLDQYVTEGQPLKGIDVGAASSVAFAFELNADGADHFAAMLGAVPSPFPPQVAIMFTYSYQYMVPQCSIQATGFKKVVYDYFSSDAKARASYFGLVNGSFDRQTVRADLRRSQGLNVHVVGEPPEGVDVNKLLDAIFDIYLKMEVGNWIEPDPKPVEASKPGGFFGGVSYAMKSVNLSETAQFNQRLTFTGIEENVHQISFNFEQQLGDFSPENHLFIEQDDIKLPFKLAIGSSDKVQIVVPSASYTTPTGPQNVQCPAVGGTTGGLTDGIIQFPWPHQPTSAQINLIVDFVEGFGPGYQFEQTKPISDTGAAFYFQPDEFIQRTHLIFIMALTVTDLTSKALFKWEWTPPQTGENSRPKIAGFTIIAPDLNGEINNLPTYDINFPYHPNDWTGESTPNIQYKIQGLTGEWKNQSTSGEMTIGERALAIDWQDVRAVGDVLAIPRILVEGASPDPVRKARLQSKHAAKSGGEHPAVTS
ncbi:hypothetical protein [Kocuria sabuli]|uniref:hypothetical protein n=1 Tax=Kocuria sabuli TaxID=3071448 RepID=UPI0034D58180